MSYEDIMSDLYQSIDAVPDAPDLEDVGPSDVASFVVALQVAQGMLGEAVARFESNARVMLPDWCAGGTTKTRNTRHKENTQ